ncbi:MAG: glycosyltransferase family 4 protein [Epulopiscium sp.]|jgi:glycosyltransferase involved in cell wall biosynthesis|nr:glycosyltransferase family 4 protein [Candidatus Epulonipiscium sp.]
MKVLQISCGFNYSSVYNNLFSELARKGIAQEVYNPQHNYFESNSKKDDYLFKYHPSKIIKSYDKLLYFTKIHRMKHDVELNFDMNNVSLIHAHSLFSDGGVAYELYKKYNIPYLVAIRNTDINKYYKYAFHLRGYAEKILLNAKRIIFISPIYRQQFSKKYVSARNQKTIEAKTVVIPNGIDSFWLNNKWNIERSINRNKIRLLSVGVVDRNKNSLNLVKACNKIIEEEGIEVDVTLVGRIKDRKYFNSLSKFSFVNHIDYLNKESLIQIYRDNDIYVMPSINETFGLVYVEAMSQGLPIIYTRGQGFDGQFKEGIVGYSVDSLEPSDIASKILRILSDYSVISKNCVKLADIYTWDKSADDIIKIYNNSLLRRNSNE